MDIQDAQREVRSVYIGGFWGQLVSSLIWLVSAALGTWTTPKASILTVVIGGFFIYPLTQMLLRMSGGRGSVSRENPFNSLGMQVAFVLPFSMLVLVRKPLQLELVLSRTDDPFGRPLSAVRHSLRNAHVLFPRGNSHRCGRRDRTLFFGNI